MLCVDGRFRVKVDSGLDVIVGAGNALVRGSLIERSDEETVTVTDDATTSIYIDSTGNLSTSGGDLIVASVVASSGSVTSITDRRRYVEPGLEVLRLRHRGTETTGTDKDGVAAGRDLNIDRVLFIIGTASAGATGSSTLDVNADGTTLFTGQGGSPESLPTIAAQSTSDYTAYPEVTDVYRGQYLTLDIDAITSGGTQAANLECLIYTYPLAV